MSPPKLWVPLPQKLTSKSHFAQKTLCNTVVSDDFCGRDPRGVREGPPKIRKGGPSRTLLGSLPQNTLLLFDQVSYFWHHLAANRARSTKPGRTAMLPFAPRIQPGSKGDKWGRIPFGSILSNLGSWLRKIALLFDQVSVFLIPRHVYRMVHRMECSRQRKTVLEDVVIFLIF